MSQATRENRILEGEKKRVFSHAVALLIFFSFILKGLPLALMDELILRVDFHFLELLIITYSLFKTLA